MAVQVSGTILLGSFLRRAETVKNMLDRLGESVREHETFFRYDQ